MESNNRSQDARKLMAQVNHERRQKAKGGYYVVWCKDCDAYVDHGWHKPILQNSASKHNANYGGHEVEIKFNAYEQSDGEGLKGK